MLLGDMEKYEQSNRKALQQSIETKQAMMILEHLQIQVLDCAGVALIPGQEEEMQQKYRVLFYPAAEEDGTATAEDTPRVPAKEPLVVYPRVWETAELVRHVETTRKRYER